MVTLDKPSFCGILTTEVFYNSLDLIKNLKTQKIERNYRSDKCELQPFDLDRE